ncbi:SusE-like outer membrane protein [Salegentibacter sp. 24]|uniref:SusE domain-containing protein n=1 Tax=Salegentibacter sp. 24 TaxID=2183986 RepID=UPI00105E4CD9|nr:SusE domain-containing protein [Salegentibacter sp. 24]TDN94990.1 SusE-like outer membrane protein [Salegentibacter sp. 24]
MKNLKRLFGAFLALVLMVSCEEEDNLDPIGQWELEAPALLTTSQNITLDEDLPVQPISFNWDPAISSERYQVRYTVVIDTAGSENYTTPLLSKTSANGGKDTQVSFTASEIDLALSYAGYQADSDAELEVAVLAKSIDKMATDSQQITVHRFESEYKPQQLYLSGTATEGGSDITQAIPLRALENADGNLTYNFETYTHLEAGESFMLYSNQQIPAHTYGGSEGELVKNGEPIKVEETGEYRLSADLENNTYSLMKIDYLSIVGDVIPNGWGGDEELEYHGNGVWQGQMYLQTPEAGQGGFLFRLNGDWGYLFKRITGTQNQLYMESQAGTAGITIEDIPLALAGNYNITVDLTGDTYTYSLEADQTSNPPSETPEALFLLSGGETVATFQKEGDVFSLASFVPLQAEVAYQLNSKEDGSGTAYTLGAPIGETSSPDADAVVGNITILEGEGDVLVAKDQAYQLIFNFSTGMANWKYYNIKLFHWDDASGDWDGRDEFLMTYEHPLQFTLTQELQAGYAMKFNSPWEVEFGADDPSAMSGTMTNGGGANFQNISTPGTYKVHIEVSDDYETGTYEFIAE